MSTTPLFCCCSLLVCLAAGSNTAPTEKQLQDIRQAASQGVTSEQGRAAWQHLSQGGPELLPHLLQAMDTTDIVTCNWLRTAFDRIVQRYEKAASDKIDTAALLTFARQPKHQGRARRLALQTVERLQPGITAKLLPGWLGDPEFRYDAVEQLLSQAKEQAKKKQQEQAIASYRRALQSSRDLPQAQKAASGLLDLGVEVSVAEQFGFLTQWYVLGPFDARNKKGFTTTYPPETQVDLKAVYEGKNGPIRWKYYQVREPSPKSGARHVALVNLADALSNADDAVGFAYTEIIVPKAQSVELRGAADDNFIIYVNGKRTFGFEEYSNGVRLDRHRAPVQLREGKNTILVKVCQNVANAAPNWEFLLRLADASGKGVAFKYALPKSE